MLNAYASRQLQRNDYHPRDVNFWREYADAFKSIQRREELEVKDLEVTAAANIFEYGRVDPFVQIELIELTESRIFVAGMISWLDFEGRAQRLLRKYSDFKSLRSVHKLISTLLIMMY